MQPATIRAADLVDVNVIAVGQQGQNWHARAGYVIVVVMDVVDDRRPGQEI